MSKPPIKPDDKGKETIDEQIARAEGREKQRLIEKKARAEVMAEYQRDVELERQRLEEEEGRAKLEQINKQIEICKLDIERLELESEILRLEEIRRGIQNPAPPAVVARVPPAVAPETDPKTKPKRFGTKKQ